MEQQDKLIGQEKYTPLRIRIVNEPVSDTTIVSPAAATKLYDLDTGKQLTVTDFNIYIKDKILMVDLKSYFVGLDVVCTVSSHIVRCFYCKNIQERIDTKQIPDYACINYLDPLHDSTALAGQLNCKYCERNHLRLLDDLAKQLRNV